MAVPANSYVHFRLSCRVEGRKPSRSGLGGTPSQCHSRPGLRPWTDGLPSRSVSTSNHTPTPPSLHHGSSARPSSRRRRRLSLRIALAHCPSSSSIARPRASARVSRRQPRSLEHAGLGLEALKVLAADASACRHEPERVWVDEAGLAEAPEGHDSL